MSVDASPGMQQRTRVNSLAEWNVVVDSTFGNTSVLSDNREFSGYLGRCQINKFELFRIRAQPSQVRKRIRAEHARASGMMLVHLQSKGTSINAQGNRRGRLQCGEAVLCDPDENYSVDFESVYEMFVLRFPSAVIAAQHPALDLADVTARRLDVHRSRLLLAFLSAAWGQLDCLEHDPDWCECVSETALDLLARSIRRSDEVRLPGATRGPHTSVLNYIRSNLTDPSLRTSMVAEAVGVSSRTVQSVFEQMATTASAFILSQRLRLAAQRLRGHHASITEISLDCGFNDPAYFSRCFRRHYGLTPRDYSRR